MPRPFKLVSDRIPANRIDRVRYAVRRQERYRYVCPPEPRLDGVRALVTGGLSGIGAEVSRGLLDRGAAEVVSVSRGEADGTAPLAVRHVRADLADLASVRASLDHFAGPLDLVICNAGVIGRRAQPTKEGIERTFAVNVLGHHLLLALLIQRGHLSAGARVVLTSCDVYCLAPKASLRYRPWFGPMAYFRSKLGVMWQARELARRHPALRVVTVHPGAVNSGFEGRKDGVFGSLRSRSYMTEEAGAQAALIAATQDLPSGTYWHTRYGILKPPMGDPALNARGARRLWDEMDQAIAPFLSDAS